jgi:hypothetical protein
VAVKSFFKKWNYSIISFTNLTRVHCMCFAVFRTGDVRRRWTSWWWAGNSDWKSAFIYYFDSFNDLNLLGYYGITYIWTEIRHYFVILRFTNFSCLKYCFKYGIKTLAACGGICGVDDTSSYKTIYSFNHFFDGI